MKTMLRTLLVLSLLAVTAAFAAPPDIRSDATYTAGGPITTDNDATCDIALLPAATLLVPYFEVDVTSPNGETTLFTITNVSPREQIAHVTLWTDLSYPVVDFNIYLTGYDVQSINLFDVIVRGVIAPGNGTGTGTSPVGDFSVENTRLDTSDCDALPGTVPPAYVSRMLQAFTLGRVPAIGNQPACLNIGSHHTNAVGYATIDLVRSCTVNFTHQLEYFEQDLLFDNVLIGDTQQVNRGQRYSEGSSMVHIRAIPEGGTAAERRANPQQFASNFERTFYSRYLPDGKRTIDGRQPLPAQFAARWISGGTTGYTTDLKIWREGKTGANPACADYKNNYVGMVDVIRFDEEENPQGPLPPPPICTPIINYPILPATSRVSSQDDFVFSPNLRGSVAGWIYLNLDNCTQDDFASQNWVISSMRSEGTFSVEFDAVPFGNGCTPPKLPSEIVGGETVIEPPGNANP